MCVLVFVVAKVFEFTVSAMVRGYHVYQEVWEVCISEILPCIREVGHRHDPYVIAVKKDEIVVGYLSHKISCICSIFIQRGGKKCCTVTNSRRYSADLAQGGMEILCTLAFKIMDKHESEKTHKLINSTMNMVEGKSLRNNTGTQVVEVKKEQKESSWKCSNLCYESSTIHNSQKVEMVDLSNASHKN